MSDAQIHSSGLFDVDDHPLRIFFFIYKVARNVRKMHKLQLSQVIRLFILTACEPVVFTFVVIPNRPVWKTPALFVI